MKKSHKILFLLSLFPISLIKGQYNDSQPALKLYDNEDLELRVGGRFMADAAFYNTDSTPMKSGAAITEGRVNSSLTYKNWDFFASFDFVKNEVHQKNIFLQYNFDKSKESQQSVRVGYYNEPSSMANNTSKYNLHYFTRPSVSVALSPGRALGATYKYYDDSFFLNQGIFSENQYNNQKAGNQGFSLSGRWLYKPFSSNDQFGGHIGVSGRYAQIKSGVQEDNILKTELTLHSELESYVDPTKQFLEVTVPWVNQTSSIGAEGLLHTNKFFVRGEYVYTNLEKDRPDEKLFVNQLGGVWSWTTLESWQKSNPLASTSFDGFYVEAGHLLKGSKYSYNNAHSVLNGNNNAGDLEVVARYSQTNLNDITEGDLFLPGKDKFYPGGEVSDYPSTSTSFAGGKLQTAVLGLNYTFNKYAKFMVAYQYSKLDNLYFAKDEDFHTLQSRIMFSF